MPQAAQTAACGKAEVTLGAQLEHGYADAQFIERPARVGRPRDVASFNGGWRIDSLAIVEHSLARWCRAGRSVGDHGRLARMPAQVADRTRISDGVAVDDARYGAPAIEADHPSP